MQRPSRRTLLGLLGATLAEGTIGCVDPSGGAGSVELLNVSYDPTYVLYREINAAFGKLWEARAGQRVAIRQSHGGSGKQARGVIDGLEADVVTLGLAYDVDAIVKAGLIARDWATRLPEHSAPFTSTIVLLVRKGNPKGVRDWADLTRPGVRVITPNPKVSGAARWGFLAAYSFELKRTGGDKAAAEDFMRRLYGNVPVLDSGARGATTTFVQRGMGDVLVSWENEALLAAHELWPGEVEVVTPTASILAETPVAVVDKVVDRRGTRAVAEAYLAFLFEEEAQRIGTRYFYRPRSQAALPAARVPFPALDLVTIADFGGWSVAQREHFGDGGTFDRIYLSK
ncbi:MAG: sulfate ABC transporter substrate-binding protein [Minicystis sp.]